MTELAAAIQKGAREGQNKHAKQAMKAKLRPKSYLLPRGLLRTTKIKELHQDSSNLWPMEICSKSVYRARTIQ